MANSERTVDILAIAAHRDDVEQTCGGTLLKMRSQGMTTAILDLTRGESGTRGTAEERASEAGEAAAILGVTWRDALDIPDGRVENTYRESPQDRRSPAPPASPRRHTPLRTGPPSRPLQHRRARLRSLLPERPRQTRAPATQRPAQTKKPRSAEHPHRPFKIVYASLYADVRPSFVVDITPFIEDRHRALMAYRTQYANQQQGSGLFVPEEEIRERARSLLRATTGCSPVSATPSPSFRKRSAWSTTSPSSLSSRCSLATPGGCHESSRSQRNVRICKPASLRVQVLQIAYWLLAVGCFPYPTCAVVRVDELAIVRVGRYTRTHAPLRSPSSLFAMRIDPPVLQHDPVAHPQAQAGPVLPLGREERLKQVSRNLFRDARPAVGNFHHRACRPQFRRSHRLSPGFAALARCLQCIQKDIGEYLAQLGREALDDARLCNLPLDGDILCCTTRRSSSNSTPSARS